MDLRLSYEGGSDSFLTNAAVLADGDVRYAFWKV